MLADARSLVDGGVDALLLENFGDAPFYPESVPTHVVATLTALTRDLVEAVSVPVGVNVLRNDAEAAVSVAAATGARFVRVNVHTGTTVTDQGLLEGRAHETLRLRDRLDASVAIYADVQTKHGRPLAGHRDVDRLARETVERALADGVIVTGAATGERPSIDTVERVSRALTTVDTDGEPIPVFVGSGVNQSTVVDCLEAGADGLIVGTAFKTGGVTANEVSTRRVRALIDALSDAGLR